MDPSLINLKKYRFDFRIQFFLWFALILNILALIFPFISVDFLLKKEINYSLLRSVILMFDAKLYVLGIIIFVFSVLFPMVKIVCLLLIDKHWFDADQTRKILKIVSRLGKWSFIDVFVVSIMMVLTNRQWVVDSSPKIGIYLFVISLLISMICSHLMSQNQIGPIATTNTRNSSQSHRFLKIFLGIDFVILILAIGLPVIEISEWLLSDRAYSIFSSVFALIHQKNYFIASVWFVFIICIPIGVFIQLVLTYLLNQKKPRQTDGLISYQIMNHWNMMDVFFIALIIFLLEGKHLIQTEIKMGLFFVSLLLLCHLLIENVIIYKTEKM